MKCFFAMYKREFRISRKSDVLRVLLGLGLLLFFWLIMVTLKSDALMDETIMESNRDAIKSFPLVISFILMYLFHLTNTTGNNHKSDINSGWLNYSYTLPIASSARCGALFLYRLTLTFIGFMISIVNEIATAVLWDRDFNTSILVYPLLFAVLITLIFLPKDFFLFKARNGEEYKKQEMLGNVFSVAVMLIAFYILMKATGFDFFEFLNNEEYQSPSLPSFGVSALAWALPLFAATCAIDYYILYDRLKNSYNTAAEQTADNGKEACYSVNTSTDSPKGFVYLFLSQNKTPILLGLAIPFACILLPFISNGVDVIIRDKSVKTMFNSSSSVPVLIAMYIIGYMGINVVTGLVFGSDNKKLFAYFVASTPGGVKDYVRKKYLICLGINLAFHAGFYTAFMILATVNYFVTGTVISAYAPVYLSGIFLMLFHMSTEIPLMFRFGVKKTSIIKLIGFISLMIILTIAFGFCSEDTQERIMSGILQIFSGNISKSLKLVLALLPFPIVILFLSSVKLSEKIYLKGAEVYE